MVATHWQSPTLRRAGSQLPESVAAERAWSSAGAGGEIRGLGGDLGVGRVEGACLLTASHCPLPSSHASPSAPALSLLPARRLGLGLGLGLATTGDHQLPRFLGPRPTLPVPQAAVPFWPPLLSPTRAHDARSFSGRLKGSRCERAPALRIARDAGRLPRPTAAPAVPTGAHFRGRLGCSPLRTLSSNGRGTVERAGDAGRRRR